MSAATWRLRRGFWNRYQRFVFRAAKPLDVPVPKPLPPVREVPFSDLYPHTPISGIVVAHRAPEDEFNRAVLVVKRLQLRLYRAISPMQRGLPPIHADPHRALAAAYPPRHQRLHRPPVRPPEYDCPERPGGVDLGGLAVASPYACALAIDDTGAPAWDLSCLGGFETHPDLVAPAARVEFEVVAGRRRLEAVHIDSELGSAAPGDRSWHASVRLALCAVSTSVSLVRHFNWVHLVVGGPLAIATHNELPHDHPLARLLRPHVYATSFGNQIVTIDQMGRGGDFENIFSFTHEGLCKLFESTAGECDLRRFHPERDLELRRIEALPIDMPAHDNRVELFGVIRDHVVRYLAIYYGCDDALRSDAPFARWVAELERVIPRGVRELAGAPVSLGGAADLLATFVYMGAVEHEIVDSGMWDYQLWNDVQPVRVHRDRQRVPLDVYQRLVNWNFSLNVDRTLLTTEFSNLALEEHRDEAQAEFRRFRRELMELQRRLDREPFAPWRMEPRFLKANINY